VIVHVVETFADTAILAGADAAKTVALINSKAVASEVWKTDFLDMLISFCNPWNITV